MINFKWNQEKSQKQTIGTPGKDAPYEVRRDCAVCLLDLGYSYEDTASITGLSLTDVREIGEAGYSPYLYDDMVDFEWNQERVLEIAQKEGVSRGMVIGMKKVIAKKKAEGDLNRARIVQDELILYMLKEDFAFRDILEATGASDEEICKLAHENHIPGY